MDGALSGVAFLRAIASLFMGQHEAISGSHTTSTRIGPAGRNAARAAARRIAAFPFAIALSAFSSVAG
ncbi:hypothetical protein [Rhizobium sp. RU35A]|uniref:hypothetical protein n=1 Tax=Rhizobium sp. RU35A TaxID=1907414 RepID=UPI00122D3D96|nr:hypothetical protein [Rhizobium sp. RU35A]